MPVGAGHGPGVQPSRHLRSRMSFTTVDQAPPRLNRSELAVPGSRPELFEKAAESEADSVFLDCEDAVAPAEKQKARKNIVAAINDIDWGEKTLSVRVNGLDTPYMYRDVIDILEKCGDRIDLLIIPKVGTAADVYALDMLVTQVETAARRKRRLGFDLIVKSALGMSNVEAIAAASPRNEALHFGVADFAASTKARSASIGGGSPHYGVLGEPDEEGTRRLHHGDMWHYALARLVVAARANGLRPLDGPFDDFTDQEGYRAQARRAAALGCEGKWAIHPRQIALANEVFSPTSEEVSHARRVHAAMREAEKEGLGAVSLDGRLIDLASIKQAENVVSRARQMAAADRARKTLQQKKRGKRKGGRKD